MNNRTGFALYLIFFCSWFLHLPARIPALSSARADLLLVCLIFALILKQGRDVDQSSTNLRTRNLLWLLVAYAAITIPFTEWPGTVAKIGFPNFFKAFVFFYFTAALVTTPQRLRTLLIVFLACQMLRVFEPLYLHATTGYWGSRASMSSWEAMDRLAGAPDDVVNPNGLAAIIVTIVPLLHYLTAASVIGRILYVASLPALLWALVLTASRSGMVGLGAIAALVWMKSRHKLALAAVVAAAVWLSIPYLNANLADRYLSIVDTHTKNAQTVADRYDGWALNLRVAMRRPLFGYGLGTSREANWHFGGSDLPAHNLYLEALQELGIFGLILFLLFVSSVVRGLTSAARTLQQVQSPPPILLRLVPALQVLIGMNLLFSFASYGLSMYDWYLMAGLTEVLVRLSGASMATAQAPANIPPSLEFQTWRPLPTRS
jgi:putative inorganic carbon (HCO3(-)) transporter